MRQRKLHIVQGGVKNKDRDWLVEAARDGISAPSWVVPKSVEPGDMVVIYVQGHGFFATAFIANWPEKRSDWQNRYGASLEAISLIEPPIPMDDIRKSVPKLTWASYPRSIHTPDIEVAKDILKLLENRNHGKIASDVDDDAFAFEGGWRLKAHFVIERNQRLAQKKKDSFLRKNGQLRCEVCEFDFFETYGKLGRGFCEVHHLQPLSQLKKIAKTKLTDLAVVCSNCHRMLHRNGGKHSIDSLRKMVGSHKK